MISFLVLLFSCDEGELDSVTSNRQFSNDQSKLFGGIKGKSFTEIKEFIFSNSDAILFQNSSQGKARIVLDGVETKYKYVTCFETVFNFENAQENLKFIIGNNQRNIENTNDDLEDVGEIFYAVGINVFKSGVYNTNQVQISRLSANHRFRWDAINGQVNFEIHDGYLITFSNLETELYDYERREKYYLPDRMSGEFSCN